MKHKQSLLQGKQEPGSQKEVPLPNIISDQQNENLKIISSRQILDPNLDKSFSILTCRSIEAVAGALGIQNGQAAASLAIAEK